MTISPRPFPIAPLLALAACSGGAGRSDSAPAAAAVFGSETTAVPPIADPQAAPAKRADLIAVPEALHTTHVPALPSAIAKAVGPYGEFRSASMLSWHPREQTLLIATRFADTAQIHEVEMPGGDRRQLTFFADRVGSASHAPSGDGTSFVLAKDEGGNEFAQLFRLDRARGSTTLLTDGKSKNALGPWSRDGALLAHTSTRRNGKDTDLWLVDPRTPAGARMVAEVEGGGWSPLDWSPDGRTLLVHEYVSASESYLWSVSVDTGERAELTPRTGERVARRGGAFVHDGAAIVYASDESGEFMQLVRHDLATGARRPLMPDVPWDVEDLAMAPDGRSIAVAVNADGFSELSVLDVEGKRRKPVVGLPAGVISSATWHPSGKVLGFSLSSARSPSDVWSYAPATGEVRRWTESETGGIPAERFVEPRAIRWKSFDGREIPGLYYPAPARFEGKRPVLVVIHGGPESQSRPGFIGRNNYYLDELGIALVYPNVRGSTGYGKSYQRLDDVEKREDSVKDVGALLDWIAATPELDADRVMVMGGSYGGYMTLATAVHHGDRVRCFSDVVGISNFVTFLERTEAYRRDLRRAEYGDERDPKVRDLLQRISPLSSADRIRKPMLVVQGRNDPRVPAAESEQIVRTLEQGGTPVWYVIADDEGHGFAKKRNQDYQTYATVAFMQEFLLR